MKKLSWEDLIIVRWGQECHLTLWIAINDIEVVCNVATKNCDITTSMVRKNPKRAIDEYRFSIVAHESKARLHEDTADFATDAAKFRRLFCW